MLRYVALLAAVAALAPLTAEAAPRERGLSRAEALAIARAEARREAARQGMRRGYGGFGQEDTRSRPLAPGGRGTVTVPNR